MPKYTFDPDLVVPPEGEPGDVPAWPLVTVEIDGERVLQTEHGTFVAFDGEPGTHEEMLEATEDWKDLGYTDDDVKDDMEMLARAVGANAGVHLGLEALLAEAVEQVRGPLHYDGDVARDIMFQLVGPDRTGEALVPIEATYSIERNQTEVWYRVATPADVENHVAAVGRSVG